MLFSFWILIDSLKIVNTIAKLKVPIAKKRLIEVGAFASVNGSKK